VLRDCRRNRERPRIGVRPNRTHELAGDSDFVSAAAAGRVTFTMACSRVFKIDNSPNVL
jgi:hypothetical protein